ncbi:unnamed protein product [Paramecium octaurelia]|uniref:Uncharacterized protein n=1 Tax=Paramecium octaurelia TaxID=43137 RepID=A0A8S1UCM4_PAROT|nr:unnamed protein product [Paramecium octaurelia]
MRKITQFDQFQQNQQIIISLQRSIQNRILLFELSLRSRLMKAQKNKILTNLFLIMSYDTQRVSYSLDFFDKMFIR